MTDEHQPKVDLAVDGAAKRQPMTPRSDTMETMTEREQIDWIEADARKLCETKMRVPSLVYIVSVVDHYALVESTLSASGGKPPTREGRMWLHVGLRPVEVIADPDKPSGLSPSRCYRCDCGELFGDDRSRSGKCAACLQRRIATTIRTPVGDIPVIADPTLKPSLPPRRPDGFDQAAVDAAKAALLATGRKL